MPITMSEEKVFIRKTSGLVRSFGTIDAFWFNFYAMNPLLGAVFAFMFSAAVFPNGHPVVGLILATIGTIFMASVYAYLTSAMPRSGGDYIFTSRILHPALGFSATLHFNFWVWTWLALNAYLTITFLVKFLDSIGLSGASAVTADSTLLFVAGLVYIVLSGVIIISGLKNYIRIQFVCAVLGLISAIVIVLDLFAKSGTFVTGFNQYAQPFTNNPDSYNYFIRTAKDLGFSGFTGFDTIETVGVMAVMWLFMCVPMASNVFAGEIKNASQIRVNMLSMGLAGLIAGLLAAAAIGGIMMTYGWEFFTSISWIALNHPEVWTLARSAEYTSLYYAIESSPAILALVMLGMFTAAFVLVPMDVIWFTRYTFAWSFDRVLPAKLADVHSRLRSPVKAIILNIVLGIIWWYLFLYTGIFSILAASLVGTMISPLLTSIAGILFPYRNKRVYDASPIKRSFGGIPAITVVGVLSTIYLLVMISYYFSFPALMGLAVSPVVGSIIVAIFVGCIAYYYVVRAYRLRKESIDINWAFREVPPL